MLAVQFLGGAVGAGELVAVLLACTQLSGQGRRRDSAAAQFEERLGRTMAHMVPDWPAAIAAGVIG